MEERVTTKRKIIRFFVKKSAPPDKILATPMYPAAVEVRFPYDVHGKLKTEEIPE